MPLSIPFKQFVFSLSPVSVLTFSQVHCVLLYSVTGSLQLPMDKKSAEFSKTNWGDHILITPRGEKFVKHASVFINKISTLKDQQWDDIYEKALAFQVILRKQRVMVREVDTRDPEPQEVVNSESDDNELLDSHYDDVPVEEGV